MLAKQQRKYFNIVWFDDSEKIFETSILSVQKEFKKRYKCDLKFETFSDYVGFINYFRKNRDEIDIIFLDIDLGDLEFDGIYVYEHIRRIDASIKIIFVSGHLTDIDWRNKIDNLKKEDINLETIKLSFPLRSEENDYYNIVSSPIVKFINSITGLFKYPFDEFLKKEKKQRENIFKRINLFNEPFAKSYFERKKEIDWMVIGHAPEKVIKKGTSGSELTAKVLNEISEKEGVMVSVYQRDNMDSVENLDLPLIKEYVGQKEAKAIDNIYAKILLVDEKYVILKCLIDEKKRIFEIREVDIEILEGVIELEMNNIVEIKTILYSGEIRVKFRDGDKSMISIFNNQISVSENKYSFAFEPLPPRDEDNF